MILLVITHRLIAQSSLRHLSDEQKVSLVDATQKNKWAYLAIVVAFGLFFASAVLGGVAIAFYLVAALTFNFIWAAKKGFPPQYRYRVLLANLVLLGGLAIIVVFAF